MNEICVAIFEKYISLYLFSPLPLSLSIIISSAIRYFTDENAGSNYLSASINNERMNYRK